MIDKQCNAAVSDLIATIAKLDSNGVQVLPESHGRAKTTSPQVSSTEYMPPADGKTDLIHFNVKTYEKKMLSFAFPKQISSARTIRTRIGVRCVATEAN